MDRRAVVTVFLRHHGDVLLLRRSDDVESYAGRWGAVAGNVEDDAPVAHARAEIEEETGLTASQVRLVRRGEPFDVVDDERGTTWHVHPFLFDASTRSIQTNWESDAAEWTSPTSIRHRDVVPGLWTSYRSVAPSVLSIREDTTHGSAALSIHALEVLRDRAAVVASSDAFDASEARSQVTSTARRLVESHPSMAALRNRVGRVLHTCGPDVAPGDVAPQAHAAIREALDADAATASHAADLVAGRRVLTLSRSGTVFDALRDADPAPSVIVAESRPLCEGTAGAEALSDAGLDTTLVTDAAVPMMLASDDVDLVLVGADTVLPRGAVVNKTGTRGAALAAHRENVPVYAACATDKISPSEDAHGESGPARDVYDGSASLDVQNPTFDVTPADLVTGGVVTERGVLNVDAVGRIADDWAALAPEWT